MKITHLSFLFLLVILLASNTFKPQYSLLKIPFKTNPGPIKTEVRKVGNGYQLFRDGNPYFIKGAGGTLYFDRLAEYGGNSVRTWRTDNAKQILDEAHKHGLTVCLGLELARERHGFDYNDTAAVAKQLEFFKGEVLKYKDHPALLMWGVGNELNLFYKNPKVWNAVNDIAKFIHEVDPYHPTTTMTAGFHKPVTDYIKTMAPEIDIMSINAYEEVVDIPRQAREFGWDGPYLVSEWGPTGHWEVEATKWDASIEETSSEKANVYKTRYETVMVADKERCIGSYVFLWGQKQERTSTWYGLFTENGEESEVVDVMQYLWTGKYPKNRAPHIDSLLLDNKKASTTFYLAPNTSYKAKSIVWDSDKDKLSYRWELFYESTERKQGGDDEMAPQKLPSRISNKKNGTATILTPEKEGAYRLYLFVSDGNNNVATGNIPFYVKN